MSYGQKADLGVGFQTSWDNSVTDVGSFHFIPYLSESIGLQKEDMVSENIRGIIDEGDSYDGKKSASGDIDCEIQPIAIGALFKSVLGNVSTVTSDALYTHTFGPRSSDFDSVSANDPVTVYKYMDDGGSAHLFYNMVGNTLEMTISNGEFLKCKAGYVGGADQQIAAVTASYPGGKRFTWDVLSVSLDGGADTTIESMTVTVNEGIEPIYTLNNSKWPSSAKRTGFRTVTVAGTLKFDNQTEYQKFKTSSEQALDLTFTGTTEVQSGYYDTVRVQAPKLRYTEFTANAGGPGLIMASFSAKAKYDATSTSAVLVTLVNTQATY